MRKQKLEMIGDADLDRVIGGTGVAQIGSDWMVGGVIGASSHSSRSSASVLSFHDDTTRAGHGPGFAGALGFLPSGSEDVSAAGPSDYAPVNAGELTEEPQDIDAGYVTCGGMNQGDPVDQGEQVDQQVDQGDREFVGVLGFLPTTGDDVNADAPSGLEPVNAGQFTSAPQEVDANVDDGFDGCGDGGGDGMGGGDGSGGGNGDGTGGGGGDGGGMGIMTCGFQDNDMPLDPNEALDDLINGLGDMGGCGTDDQGTAEQNDPGYNRGPDAAAIAPQPGLGHLR